MPKGYGERCLDCPYMKNTVKEADKPLSMENNSSNILLIFQAPGETEWKEKMPICSKNSKSAAARIRNSLTRIGKSRINYNITNATQCLPGKSASGRDKKPVKAARKKCASWLKADIDSFEFQKIIVFGSLAKESIHSLGYGTDSRLIFLRHPSGGLSNNDLDLALSVYERSKKDNQ